MPAPRISFFPPSGFFFPPPFLSLVMFLRPPPTFLARAAPCFSPPGALGCDAPFAPLIPPTSPSIPPELRSPRFFGFIWFFFPFLFSIFFLVARLQIVGGLGGQRMGGGGWWVVTE